VPESQGPSIRGRSYNILAEVEIQSADAAGVLTATGSRFGGHSLFLKAGKPYYVYNFLGINEQQFVAEDAVDPGKHVIGVSFVKEKQNPTGEFTGTLQLHVDGTVVAEGPMITQPGFFMIFGEGLCVGRDSGDSVSAEYKPPFALSGGVIAQVEFNVSGEPYADFERDARAAYAHD
jgi:hypothetical protein